MYLVDLDVFCSVIVNAFYALTWVHNFVCENENFNPLNNPLVKSVVEAAKRKVSKPSIHKPALPTECLVNFCTKFHCSDDVLDRCDVAMFLILYSGFLRYDELKNLLCKDIRFHESHLSISGRKSKMDQLRNGQEVLIARTGRVSCPVNALERYFSVAGIVADSDDFLFKPGFRVKGIGGLIKQRKCLSYTRATEIFRGRFEEWVPNIRGYSLHSCRSGGASAAAQMGVSDRFFQRHGRWKSASCKNRYVEDSLDDRLSVSKSLGL